MLASALQWLLGLSIWANTSMSVSILCHVRYALFSELLDCTYAQLHYGQSMSWTLKLQVSKHQPSCVASSRPLAVTSVWLGHLSTMMYDLFE